MTVRGEIEFTAGGYPLPTYHGVRFVGANVEDTADFDSIREELRRRGQAAVAREYAMTLGLVRVDSVKIL